MVIFVKDSLGLYRFPATLKLGTHDKNAVKYVDAILPFTISKFKNPTGFIP